MEAVLMKRRGGVGYITLNRPEKHNSMNHQMVAEIVEALRIYDADEDVKVIVLKGAGKSFCAGYDMSPDKKPFTTFPEWRKEGVDSNKMDYGIWDNKKPVIAQVHGYCLAGGCDLMLCCDFTIAADNTIFSEPELEFSTHPSFLILPYIVPIKEAKYLLFTGERIGVEEGRRLGMVQKVFSLETLEEETFAIANKIAKLSSPAMDLLKKNINKAAELAGMRQMMYWSEESFVASKMQLSDVAKKFFAMAESEGMQAAIKWRTKYFADGASV